jgi:ribonuclease P protein component
MLPGKIRLTRALFKPLIASRHFYHSEHFILRAAPSNTIRIGVSVSKKVAKSAVVRNKIRRRVYSALKELMPIFKPALYLFVAKSGAEKNKAKELLSELTGLISSAKV